jgi:hypothetical protein
MRHACLYVILRRDVSQKNERKCYLGTILTVPVPPYQKISKLGDTSFRGLQPPQPVPSSCCPHLKNSRENWNSSSSLPTINISLRGHVIFPYSQIMQFCVSTLTKHHGTYRYLRQNIFVAILKSFPDTRL